MNSRELSERGPSNERSKGFLLGCALLMCNLLFAQQEVLVKPVGYCPKWLTSSVGSPVDTVIHLSPEFSEEVYTAFQLSKEEISSLDQLLKAEKTALGALDLKIEHLFPFAQTYGTLDSGSSIVIFFKNGSIDHAYLLTGAETDQVFKRLQKKLKKQDNAANLSRFIVFQLESYSMCEYN